jgi:hypothetical protein
MVHVFRQRQASDTEVSCRPCRGSTTGEMRHPTVGRWRSFAAVLSAAIITTVSAFLRLAALSDHEPDNFN